jgi:ABC-type lipoprotein release transport system permease subunit
VQVVSDASSFAAAIMALLVISDVASYLPAHRAAEVDPSVTLRAEWAVVALAGDGRLW